MVILQSDWDGNEASSPLPVAWPQLRKVNLPGAGLANRLALPFLLISLPRAADTVVTMLPKAA